MNRTATTAAVLTAVVATVLTACSSSKSSSKDGAGASTDGKGKTITVWLQADAQNETAEASVGGGMVKVTANGAGQVLSVTISPDAVDPSDVEGLQDLVLAGVNEALRAANAKVEAKAQQMQSELLGGLGLPGLGG